MSSEHKARATDVESPDSIVNALYNIISGEAGSRNWYRLRSLYLEGALLLPIGKRVHKEADFGLLTLDDWIHDATEYFEKTDFFEKEIMKQSHRFGNIVQVFSTYEAREKADGQPIARGINSIQLVFHEERWWIVSVVWDNESKDNPIPGEFLPYLW